MLSTTAPTSAQCWDLTLDFTRRPLAHGSGPRKVLVVEDEPSLREVLGELLQENGYDVDSVPTCLDGLLHLLRRSYDYLVLDLVLPEASGLFLYDQVARLDTRLAGRTVFITGAGDENPLVQRASALQVPVLSKPFTVTRLVDTLARCA